MTQDAHAVQQDARPGTPDARDLRISLISHTNAGKTTLARTLLGRDVGEVADRAHVTETADVHVLLQSSAGDRLLLWDTPGFGDSARLLGRLRMSGNPLGWLLSQVWDRYRDRPFWSSQQAVRNARDDADVVLYLVNAAEAPESAGYVDPEMQILGWIGKPVIVVLNQVGPPRGPQQERDEVERWRAHLASVPIVRAVLVLDAFTRCWLHEAGLLDALARQLPPAAAPVIVRLSAAWQERNLERFQASIGVLAQQLAQALADRAWLDARGWKDTARDAFTALGWARTEAADPREQAMGALATRLDAGIRAATDRLIALHGLDGHAASEVLSGLRDDYAATEPVDARAAAVWGGLASGALGGLAADLASGGLSLGLGMLAGGIAGALGAGGLARGYNLARGRSRASLRWSCAFTEGLVRSALLRYLAVAHFGRGRGRFDRDETPAVWQARVADAVRAHGDALQAVWTEAGADPDQAPDAALLEPPLAALLRSCAWDVLAALYPDAGVARLRAADGARRDAR